MYPTTSTDPTPWAADSLTYAMDQAVQPCYTVRRVPYQECTHTPPHVIFGAALDAYDVEVTYDTNRQPYAEAKFALPPTAASYQQTTPASSGIFVEILAGWVRAGGRDEHTIFYGLIQSSELDADSEGNVARIVECIGTEAWWDHPFKSGTWNVNNGAGGIASLTTYMNAEPTRLYRSPLVAQTVGTLNTPSAAQLAAFRDMEIQAGENLLDFYSALAAALGQRLRGDHRHRIADTPQTGISIGHDDGVSYTPRTPSTGWIVTDATRYAAAPVLALDGLVDELKVRDSFTDYANFLELTAQWGVGGATRATTVFPALPVSEGTTPGIIRVQSQTVNMRPPAGVLAATNPVGLAWAQYYYRRTWTATITARALWWLDCDQRISWPNVTAPDGPILPAHQLSGEVATIRFDVDAGLMTITARPFIAT